MEIKNRLDIIKLFVKNGYKKGVDLGTGTGRYAEKICEAIPNVEIYCIDPFELVSDDPLTATQERAQNNYQIAHQRLDKYKNAKIIKGYSMDVVKDFKDESLGFIYIDGNHLFDYVMMDLIHWTPKIRKGGIVAGDDYGVTRKGVNAAVNAYINAHNYKLNTTKKDTSAPLFHTNINFWFVK